MIKAKMTRKEFLAHAVLFISGIFFFPFQKLFSNPKKSNGRHIKEAKYFRPGEHLAG